MPIKLVLPGRPFLPHQKKAWTYAEPRTRVALFMEMRLGKTMVAIRWAKHHVLRRNPNARILVLAGTSALEPGWLNELKAERIPADRVHPLWRMGRTADRTAYAEQRQPGWYLNNYEAMVRMGVRFAALDWDAIVCDESTAFRNPKAKITKLLTKFYTYIEYRAILTGLPNPESELDMIEQMRFLIGHFLGFQNFWAARNALFKQIGYDWSPKTGVRERMKQFTHSNAFFLSAEQAGMGNKQIFEPRLLEPTPEQVRATKMLRKEFKYENMETKWATVREVWMARVAGGWSPDRDNPIPLSDAKIKELWALMTGDLKGQQLVVWFRFIQELEATNEFLRRKGVDTGVIMGSVPVAERGHIATSFQRGKTQVILHQIQTGKGGMGSDFSAANTAVYYSMAYDYEYWAQSLKRIDHPTKRTKGKGLLYIPLLTKRTVDEDAYEALRAKGVTAKSFRRELWSRIIAREAGVEAGSPEHGRMVRRVFPGQDE